MNPILRHVASGDAFFSGLALVALAVVLRWRAAGGWRKRAVGLFVPIGVLLVAISSTPLPIAAYVVAAVALVCWLMPIVAFRWPRTSRVALVCACVALASWEGVYRFAPRLARPNPPSFAVVADSITAGLSVGETTWPSLVGQRLRLSIQDRSHVGETAASALKRVVANPIDASLVLVEIGGNDFFGPTTPAEFERDLDALLGHLARPGRRIAMFELPLPPFYHAYGYAQRKLARRYGVALIPKRILLAVLAPTADTVNTLHLTQAGHDALADAVVRLIDANAD